MLVLSEVVAEKRLSFREVVKMTADVALKRTENGNDVGTSLVAAGFLAPCLNHDLHVRAGEYTRAEPGGGDFPRDDSLTSCENGGILDSVSPETMVGDEDIKDRFLLRILFHRRLEVATERVGLLSSRILMDRARGIRSCKPVAACFQV